MIIATSNARINRTMTIPSRSSYIAMRASAQGSDKIECVKTRAFYFCIRGKSINLDGYVILVRYCDVTSHL